MKKYLIILGMMFLTVASQATETITIVSPYNAGYSGQTAMMEVINQANRNQNRYKFILDNHPGAQGLLALSHAQSNPGTRIAIIAAGAVELFETQKANEKDWVPVHAIGDACWAVVTNWPANERLGIKSLRPPPGNKELVIGAVGLGSVSHLVGLEVAEYLGYPSLTVLFKSGTEAFLNLASGNGANITIDSVQTIENMKIKNPNIRMIATICTERNPMAPHVPTLHEQGLPQIPSVFNIILAFSAMPQQRRREIGEILDQATRDVGLDKIFNLSGFRSPVFKNQSAQQFYDLRVGQIKNLHRKHAKELAVLK